MSAPYNIDTVGICGHLSQEGPLGTWSARYVMHELCVEPCCMLCCAVLQRATIVVHEDKILVKTEIVKAIITPDKAVLIKGR